MNQDQPEEFFADEDVQARQEVELLHLQARMYAAMARRNALIAVADAVDSAVASLLADLKDERGDDLRRRMEELERVTAHPHVHYHFGARTPSQALIREADAEAEALQRQFEERLRELWRGDDSLEQEAGVFPPLGLSRREYLNVLRRRHLP